MGHTRVIVFDTTLRDGEQAPGCSMTVEEKLRLARQLDKLGVDVIEAGFPIASDGDFAAVQAVAREIRRPSIAGLARTRKEDIERDWEALREAERPRIHIFLATSDIHLQCKLRITRDDALRQIDGAIARARGFCDDVEFSPEDATRSELEFLCRAVQTAVDAGATTINIPDTVGYTVPEEFRAIIGTLREKVRGIENVVISVHCHDDLGLAVSNTLAALDAGARQVECTVNGIGERAGNAALEEIVMAMRVRPDRLAFDTGVCAEEIYNTSQLLARTIAFAPQPNKAVVGANAFAHEAGIHQHGVLSNPLCYEIMTPESIGAPGNRIVLGKHSGRHALAKRYGEMGYIVAGVELDGLYRAFTAMADRKKNIYDQDLIALLPRAKRAPEKAAGRAAFAD